MTEIATTGDLARQLILRRQNADTRAQMDALVGEVSTGRKADLPKMLRGDYSAIASIERDLAVLESYRVSSTELGGRAEAMARALDAVQSSTDAMAPKLLRAESANRVGYVEIVSAEARQTLDGVLGALNTRFAGRALFAGAATGASAVIDTQTLLAELGTAVAGASDAEAMEAAIRDWFAPGNGFDNRGYLGAADPVAPQPLGKTRSLGLAVTAADPRFREMLIGYSMAALADGPQLAGDLEEQAALAARAGLSLSSAISPLSDLAAEVGSTQAELDLIETGNAAEATALKTARGDLVDADIFDSAGRLEAIQSQLELLYAITARTSRLSLANYL